MSEEWTCIPVWPLKLQRNDHIVLPRPASLDPAARLARVTGVRAHAIQSSVIVVNVEHDGKRRHALFSGKSYAHKQVYIAALRVDGPWHPLSEGEPLPDQVLLRDEAGDLAWCEGEVGAWLRVDERWTACPPFWAKSKERFRKWSFTFITRNMRPEP